MTYTYDKGGNITQKSVYPFTTGTVGTATDTITYAYDNVWKDKLPSYDGTALTYRCSLDQLFEMKFELYSCYGEKELICARNEKHWWLAGIVVNPIWTLQGKAKRLSMSAKIEFLDSDMAQQFLDNINPETLDGYYDYDESLVSSSYVGIKWTEKECDLDKLDYLT